MNPITVTTGAADLRVGDRVMCDYLPILWFDVEQNNPTSKGAGTAKNFRTRLGAGTATGITGSPVTDRPGTVVAVIPVTDEPIEPVDSCARLALHDQVVDTLHRTLTPGHVIVLICPDGRSSVDRVVRTPDSQPITIVHPVTPESRAEAIDLLVGFTPMRDLISYMRKDDLGDEIGAAISRALIEVVSE